MNAKVKTCLSVCLSLSLSPCLPVSPPVSLSPISPPAYVQTSRALMVCACLLGLPAVLLVLMSMPCIRLQNDSSTVRQRRSRVGGVLFLCVGENPPPLPPPQREAAVEALTGSLSSSFVWRCLHRLVSSGGSQRRGPDELRLLPVRWVGGGRALPPGGDHHPLLPFSEPRRPQQREQLLLLQTGQQGRSAGATRQPRQERQSVRAVGPIHY